MTRLCHIDDIQDPGSKGFELDGSGLFAVRAHGSLRVYRNRCPHLGVALEWLEDQFLDIGKEFIQCATHGALFRIDNGDCVYGPCIGQRLEPVEFELRDGYIHLVASA